MRLFNALVIASLSVSACCAQEAWRPVQPTSPQSVRVSGDLNKRIKLAVSYLDQATRQQLWSGFEKRLTDDHSFGLWGADWPGRTLEAYARTSLILGQPASRRFDEIGFGLLANQSRDGAFHN